MAHLKNTLHLVDENGIIHPKNLKNAIILIVQ